MLYRIDFEHFLVHAIDHFTKYELNSFHFIIISAGIVNTAKVSNVTKINTLFPNGEIFNQYMESHNLTRFNEFYKNQLDDYEPVFYKSIISPLDHHKSVVLICRQAENFIIDYLCKYILEKYKIDTIDLNHLFIHGVINDFNFDLDEFKKICIEQKIKSGKELIELKKQSPAGRTELFEAMKKKDKIHLIKEIGYNHKKLNNDNIDKIIKT